MQVENRAQVLRGEDYFVIVVAQPVVEDVGNGSHEDIEEELQESDEGREVISDWDFVLACAVGLRKDLSEDHNSYSRDDDGQVAGHDLIQEDR